MLEEQSGMSVRSLVIWSHRKCVYQSRSVDTLNDQSIAMRVMIATSVVERRLLDGLQPRNWFCL